MKYKIILVLGISLFWFNVSHASTYKEIKQCLADAAKIESTQSGTWDASLGMMMYNKSLTMACYRKYPNSIMTKEEKYTEEENKLYDQWKTKPYGCLQMKPHGTNQLGRLYKQSSGYENVCVDGMTDEEHEKVVKEFEPYVKNPSLFYDKTWTDAKKVLLLIKKGETHETQAELIDRIVNQYVYGGNTQSSYQKEGVSKKTFKDFITKKMNEIDTNKEITKEKAKIQAKKQKEAQEKRTLDKLIKETSKPYLEFIIKGKQKQFYLDYQRTIAPYFKDFPPQQNITNDYIDTVSSSILNALADFEATQNSIISGKEDEFKDAFSYTISKKYGIIKD